MKTHISSRKTLFIRAMIYIFICFFAAVISLYVVKLKFLSILIILLMLLPLLFIRQLIRKFTQEVEVNINSIGFEVKVFNEAGVEQETKTDFSEIMSYSIQIPNDRFISVLFRFRNGLKREYSFFQRKYESDDVGTEELINLFHLSIKEYNKNAISANRILFTPSFYASKEGLVVILLVTILLLTAVFLIIIYGEKPISTSFLFSMILVIQLMVKRRKEWLYYDKIKREIV